MLATDGPDQAAAAGAEAAGTKHRNVIGTGGGRGCHSECTARSWRIDIRRRGQVRRAAAGNAYHDRGSTGGPGVAHPHLLRSSLSGCGIGANRALPILARSSDSTVAEAPRPARNL